MEGGGLRYFFVFLTRGRGGLEEPTIILHNNTLNYPNDTISKYMLEGESEVSKLELHIYIEHWLSIA